MKRAVAREIEIAGYRFGLRKVTAMECFERGMAEANVWVLQSTHVQGRDEEPLRSALDSAAKWIRAAVVWGKRPGTEDERECWVPVKPGEETAPEGAIDVDAELGFDFLTLAAAARDMSGLTGEAVSRVYQNFFRLGLIPSTEAESEEGKASQANAPAAS
ncbi:MAG: hypothetical protein ACE5FA_05300 [Dehalococcoidia bacterium]